MNSDAYHSWNYYITDHLGSMRKVVTSTDTVKEPINYYPYGSEMKMTDPAMIILTKIRSSSSLQEVVISGSSLRPSKS